MRKFFKVKVLLSGLFILLCAVITLFFGCQQKLMSQDMMQFMYDITTVNAKYSARYAQLNVDESKYFEKQKWSRCAEIVEEKITLIDGWIRETEELKVPEPFNEWYEITIDRYTYLREAELIKLKSYEAGYMDEEAAKQVQLNYDKADQLALEADAALRQISNEYGLDEKK